jgi:PadR family transcriptional regulator PadR
MLMDKIEQQLKKGVVEIIVLDLLSKKDAYGYEIITFLDEQTNGYYKMKEGSLYPILYRLEDKQLIESFRKELDNSRKVPRKYYRITVPGQEALQEMKQAWNLFRTVTDKVLMGGNE